jgi:hypothetical protein
MQGMQNGKIYKLVFSNQQILVGNRFDIEAAIIQRTGIFKELQYSGFCSPAMVDDMISQLYVEDYK